MRVIKVLLAISLVISLPNIAWAAMSSTNYYIYSDSLDYGGDLATSTSNNLQDSVGSEIAIGDTTSTSYEVKAGYQGMKIGTLTLSLDSNTVDFGKPAANVLVTSSLVATVNTDSDSGYTLSVSSISGSSLISVSDGSVDGSGSTEEYGLKVTGNHSAYADDRAIVAGLILSSNFSPAVNDQTTLIFKAVRSTDTVIQNYSQNIILTVAAN